MLKMLVLAAGLLTIKVSPQAIVSFKPVTVTVQARFQPADNIRSIGASIVGSDYGRSSSLTLEGANAAPLQVFEWRNVPPGEYDVQVELYDSSNKVLGRDVKQVRIMGVE